MPKSDDDARVRDIVEAGQALVDQLAAVCRGVHPEVALSALLGAALGCAVNATETRREATALFGSYVDRIVGRLEPLWPEISERKNGKAN